MDAEDSNLWRFHASDLQASMIGSATLDSNVRQQYSFSTTRARN